MIEQVLTQITNEYGIIFFIRQTFTILVLFVYGYLMFNMLSSVSNSIYNIFIAFPMGLSVLGICGLILLITGIKYCPATIILSMALCLLITFLANRKKINMPVAGKTAIFAAAAIIIIALISVSGVIALGFTNDSMYYYSEYPRAVVSRGCLYYGFDTFLTDAGQTTMIINTLPYLFGFDEAFGIHTFFNINFIAFFAYAVYEQAHKRFECRKPLIITALFTLLLITSMPFVLISKWNIANVYFMEQMFICLYMFFRTKSDDISDNAVLTILLMMLSFMRIEGSLYAALILLCAMTLDNIKRKDITIPAAGVLVLQVAYFAKVFIFTKLYATYTFMTNEKVIVIIVLYIAIIVYACVFADSGKISYNRLGAIFGSIKNKINYVNQAGLYVAALLIANIAVFLYDKAEYTENIRAIILNVLQNSGWGIFPAVVLALIILVPKVRTGSLYFDTFYICFALMSIVACCLRGGELRVSFADSGNRVFMQIVPFVIYAFAYRFIVGFKALEEKEQ